MLQAVVMACITLSVCTDVHQIFGDPFMYSSLFALQSLSSDRLHPNQCKTPVKAWGKRNTILPIHKSALVAALEQKQMQAWFQPKVCLHTQRLVAVEILVRWCHPEKGVVAPNVFLPWSRVYGLDEALLLYMLQEALAFQAHWRNQGVVVPVSVNVPTYLLDDPYLADKLCQTVGSYQGTIAGVTLELLESSETTTSQALCTGANRLIKCGFGLALDDFGVGHSSIQRLMLVPFSELKLDRSLVQGVSTVPKQAARVRAVIDICKQRDLVVTAEGVERSADAEFLRQVGCDHAQGYMFAKPLPAAELAHWMRRHGLD